MLDRSTGQVDEYCLARPVFDILCALKQ